uniref:Uncharacterized protein n=1 Tax=Daucus carota subsp. sativus TaxID=79200 RepID=A0A166H5J0_DAUCS
MTRDRRSCTYLVILRHVMDKRTIVILYFCNGSPVLQRGPKGLKITGPEASCPEPESDSFQKTGGFRYSYTITGKVGNMAGFYQLVQRWNKEMIWIQ